MPTHSETQFSPYSPQQLFELVADVEKYPQFLPWCRAARISERGEGEFLAELIIAFKHISERYTSRVQLSPGQGEGDSWRIEVTQTSGPFSHLTNRWTFTPRPEGGTKIDFFLDFGFRVRLLEKLIGPLFSAATRKMAGAFAARAHALYGKG